MTDKTDGERCMAWWNGLSPEERRQWMRRAGNTGRVSDCWEEFKRQETADRTGDTSAT